MSQRDDTQNVHEIHDLLARLRQRIRWYVIAEGTALVLVLLAALFWASMGVDWLYFAASRLDLPVWFRKLFVVGTISLFALGLTVWVALRVAKHMRAKALALVLERRFPELGDRLVTAVELSEKQRNPETPLAKAMLARTVRDAAALSSQLDLGNVFDRAPLRRAIIAAVVLLASICGFAVTSQAAMARWARAYLRWDERYWQRDTELALKVIAQPGDRVREFVDGQYKHPRGADLMLRVEVPPEHRVPEQVMLQYRLAGGRGSGRITLSPVGEREFQYTFTGVLDDIDLWVRGGDFANRYPYRVIQVDPPRVDQIVLQCRYPEYTGLPVGGYMGERDPRLVQGTQISLPMETNFVLDAACNKPLVAARIQTDAFDLDLRDGAARLIVRSQDGGAEKEITFGSDIAGGWMSSNSRLQVPFLLSAQAPTLLAAASPAEPIPMAPESLVRIFLEDTDGVMAVEPARVTIGGIIDQPPLVETELQGVGTSITRQAVIPVKGKISDDYGIEKARFEFQVGTDENWRVRPFHNVPSGKPREFKLERSAESPVERFDVLPLDLAVGQKLNLSVFAQDGDNVNGPHTARGQPYAFTIVSPEELLSILFTRELNLRRQFEQIIRETEAVQQDLVQHRERAAEAQRLRGSSGLSPEQKEQVSSINTAVSVCAERTLHQVRKNASETAAVEGAFRGIFEELVNNAIYTGPMVERIEGLVIRPLNQINEIDYPQVDGAVGLFRLANEKGNDPVPAIDDSVARVDEMLVHMKAVLNEMQDLLELHEAIRDLKSIIDDEGKLAEETKEDRKKKLIEGLRDLQ